MRLYCDRMLGSLARWLRFMGHDVHYPTVEVDDDDILEFLQKDDRTLVTRDRALAQRVPGSILLTSTVLETQIDQVLTVTGVPTGAILTRCGICNSLLEHVEKEKVKGIVPDSVYERQDEFMLCRLCEKIYWQGSHFDRIKRSIDAHRT